jgi:hypothetical protein
MDDTMIRDAVFRGQIDPKSGGFFQSLDGWVTIFEWLQGGLKI